MVVSDEGRLFEKHRRYGQRLEGQRDRPPVPLAKKTPPPGPRRGNPYDPHPSLPIPRTIPSRVRTPTSELREPELIVTENESNEPLHPRILVVDDEPPIREILKFQLENAGFEVACAETGQEGLRMVESESPDLVLLDLMIPEMDGYEVCRRLKGAYTTRQIPVIILTARGELDEKLKGLENGANDYVTKPFSMPELIMRIRNVLNWSQSQREANPLTGLPGNVSIERELTQRLEADTKFAFIYTDIDNFKAFNDYYGYAKGDEAIKLTAGILTDAVAERGNVDDFLGHIGGDDFVVMTTPDRSDAIARSVLDLFNRRSHDLFEQEDLARGYLKIRKRSGEVMKIKSLGITLAIVTNEKGPISHIGRVADIASELKRYGKSMNGSVVVRERRADA
jgi:diguanylate cyclase (GGDEF)-like protein